MKNSNQSHFEGYKVIELSSVLAGPFTGMLFSELGAQVIKIENKKTNGDVTRTWKLPSENPSQSTSAYYGSVNYQKEVHFMDFTNMNDINKTYKLLSEADVVITNFKYGDDYKFALDYARVKIHNPKIIYAKLTGFEHEVKRTAYDVIIQAETGFMSMNGQPSSPPTKMPVALMDVLAGHQLRTGILTALLKREKSGKGSLVEVSLERSGYSGLVNQATNYLMANHIAKRQGSRHPNIALYGEIFNCSNNSQIVLALGSQKHFEILCEVLNYKNLSEDQRFNSNQQRIKNLEELVQLIAPQFLSKSADEWVKQLNNSSIPAGKINNLEEALSTESAREMILTENIDNLASTRLSTVAFKIS